ncbi:hypothetical protein ASC95_28650 [Pelomonas sp. Root1217]|uniref:hypothetical protein n=1 Tax=Pelomonas sp. Root1217 TaxID=1736430 RepID=UPI00070F0EC0|nr:hypothetical protein [Pelomonas sp. Root1217]KQV58098.1 hypothetical protein ASC95_28650 [Pelomonas sp. Root1217]
MRRRQIFRFSAQSETLVEQFLRSLRKIALLDEERESFVFTQRPNEQPFEFHCVIVQGGIEVQWVGDGLLFLGAFVDGLTSEFKQVSMEDA